MSNFCCLAVCGLQDGGAQVGWAMGLFGGAGLRCWCSVEVIEVWSSWAARMTLGGAVQILCMYVGS